MARQIAISDIHGCAKTFEKLISDVLVLQPTDSLFLLGDYINKGPDSKGVLDLIFSLIKERYSVQFICGNHEQYLIQALNNYEHELDFLSRGGIETLQSFGVHKVSDIPEKYLDFILQLPLYIELDEYLLIHAGLDFNLENPFNDENAMLNIRSMIVDLNKTGGRKIIHGHVPTPLTEIEKLLDFKLNHISIDAGCVYQHIHALNHLVALDIDQRKLYIQENAE